MNDCLRVTLNYFFAAPFFFIQKKRVYKTAKTERDKVNEK